MAQRAVAIAARYSSCLSVKRETDLFNIGSASGHCPFAVSSIARSTEEVAPWGAFSAVWAARKLAAKNAASGTCSVRQTVLVIAKEDSRIQQYNPPGGNPLRFDGLLRRCGFQPHNRGVPRRPPAK